MQDSDAKDEKIVPKGAGLMVYSNIMYLRVVKR